MTPEQNIFNEMWSLLKIRKKWWLLPTILMFAITGFFKKDVMELLKSRKK